MARGGRHGVTAGARTSNQPVRVSARVNTSRVRNRARAPLSFTNKSRKCLILGPPRGMRFYSVSGGEPFPPLARTSRHGRLTERTSLRGRLARRFRRELRRVARSRPVRVSFSSCSHSFRGTGGHVPVSSRGSGGHDLELSRGENAESELTQPCASSCGLDLAKFGRNVGAASALVSQLPALSKAWRVAALAQRASPGLIVPRLSTGPGAPEPARGRPRRRRRAWRAHRHLPALEERNRPRSPA